MRNNERQRAPFRLLISTDSNSIQTISILIKKALANILTPSIWSFLLPACFFYTASSFATENFSNVNQGLPPLVNEGEALRDSQQWYRAHSNQNSFSSDFSADARFLALTSHKNPVELWDTNKRTLVATFEGGGSAGSNAFVKISPDARYIAIHTGEHIEIRNLKTKLQEFTVPSIPASIGTFSSHSHWFAVAIDGKRLDIWNTKTKRQETKLQEHTRTISSLDFSPDRNFLVSADISGLFCIWDMRTKNLITKYTEHKTPITTVRFSHSNDQFVTVDTSGAIKLWDAKANKIVHRFITPNTGAKKYNKSSAAFSPDGKTFVVTLNQPDGKSYLHLFSTLIGGKPLFTYENNDHEISNIAFRPNGNSLVVSLDSKTIKVFDIPGRHYVDTFGGQILKANKSTVSPDGKLFATGTVDGHIQLWDAHKKALKYSVKGRNKSIEHISFSPDGAYIIAGDSYGAVNVWQRDTLKRVFFIKAHKSGSAIAVMSPDNRFLATASSKSSIIKLWDVRSNTRTSMFRGHNGDITDLAYSPDGKYIASSSRDGTVKLWNISNKSIEHTFIGSEKVIAFLSLAFSSDGQYLAAGTDQGLDAQHFIEVWNIRDKTHLRTLKSHDAPISTLHFSKDGQQLASGSSDGVIKVWQVNTGQETHSIATNTEKEPVNSVDFTNDGKNILSVNYQGSTDLWNLKLQKKAFTFVDGPRGNWASEDHIKKKFFRGDDGSLYFKNPGDLPPAPLAPKGLANKDTLVLSTSRKRVKVAKNGGKFSITIKNLGKSPAFWLRARQLHNSDASVTLLSNKLTRLNPGQRGILNLKLIPHNLNKLAINKHLNLEMEIVTRAGSRFPIVIPLEFQDDLTHGRNQN